MKKWGAYRTALLIILLVGFILRVYQLASVPAGFYADEASVGLNAFTILTSGKDQHDVVFPVFFRAFGEYKSPLAVYSAVPFVLLFGLNEFAVRFQAVVFGVLGIWLLYLVVRELFKNHPKGELISLLSAGFLAVSPWHVHLSRIGWDSQVGFVFLALLAVFVFLKSLDTPKILPWAIVLFGMAMYSYLPAQLFMPLLGIGVFILNFRFFLRHKSQLFAGLAVLAIFLFPLILHVFSDEGMARWREVSIFQFPPKDQGVSAHIVYNYASHFMTEFLFSEGDTNYFRRHSVPGMGVLYWFQLPLILLGLLALCQRRYSPVLLLLIVWLALYPLGTAFTISKTATATRSVIGVVPLQILSGVGLYALVSFFSRIDRVWRALFWSVFSIVVLVSFLQFTHLYFDEYSVKYPGYDGWQMGPKEVVKYFLTVDDRFDELFMSQDGLNGAEIFIPFYSKNYFLGCSNCKVGAFDKFDADKKQLFAARPHEVDKFEFKDRFKVKHTVLYPDKGVSYVIGVVE
jgi:4-amino-4-deoxy-L-arabinose transferase-like glycosyltransferase